MGSMNGKENDLNGTSGKNQNEKGCVDQWQLKQKIKLLCLTLPMLIL